LHFRDDARLVLDKAPPTKYDGQSPSFCAEDVSPLAKALRSGETQKMAEFLESVDTWWSM
jgi:hypothetical protein